MIYGIPIDTVVAVTVWTVAAVMAIPAIMGMIVIALDIKDWLERRGKK